MIDTLETVNLPTKINEGSKGDKNSDRFAASDNKYPPSKEELNTCSDYSLQVIISIAHLSKGKSPTYGHSWVRREDFEALQLVTGCGS